MFVSAYHMARYTNPYGALPPAKGGTMGNKKNIGEVREGVDRCGRDRKALL